MSRNSGRNVIAPAVAIGLVLVSAVTLVAYLSLSAYAPDFGDNSDGAAHALSKSAIGFAGLRILLQETGIENTVERHTIRSWPGLRVLTPSEENSPKDVLKKALGDAPSLIILPKWWPLPDPASYGRIMKGATINPRQIEKLLDLIAKGTKVAQRHDETSPQWVVSANSRIAIAEHPAKIDSLQTISGKAWIPLITDRRGGIVLAKLPAPHAGPLEPEPLYVLADPDLMNNHGLADVSTSGTALAVIETIRAGRGQIAFDVTLNGFGKSRNILRTAFEPPFLGATLCAILAAIFVGFHAAVRFGSPAQSGPVFSSGKRALVTNAAGMIHMLHREPRMATRYALVLRNLVLKSLGNRGSADLSGIALGQGKGPTYELLVEEANQASDREALLSVARKLFQWREGAVHER